MGTEREPERTPALFVGGPYDGAVIAVEEGAPVVHAAEPPTVAAPQLHSRAWAYTETTVLLLGREVRAFTATVVPSEDEVARRLLTRDAYRLWSTAPAVRPTPTPAQRALSC